MGIHKYNKFRKETIGMTTELRDAIFKFLLSKPGEGFTANDIILYVRENGYRVKEAEVLDILNKSVTKEYVELNVKPLGPNTDNSGWYAAGRKLKQGK